MFIHEPGSEGRCDAARIDHATNVAQTVLVAHQTIYQDGKPRWIQELGLRDLEKARDRLYSASRRHENTAFMAILAPVLVAMLMLALFGMWAQHFHEALSWPDKLFVTCFCLLLAIPVWFSLYDVRRRHRQVVAAAEGRWAEIVVEIALRTGFTT